MQLALFGCFRRHIETVLYIMHGTAWGKIQHVVSETLCKRNGNIALCIMGLCPSLTTLRHSLPRWDLRTLYAARHCGVLHNMRSFPDRPIALLPRHPGIHAHPCFLVPCRRACWHYCRFMGSLCTTMSMSSFVTAQERQPCLSRV